MCIVINAWRNEQCMCYLCTCYHLAAGIPSYDELQAMVDALANELEVVGR